MRLTKICDYTITAIKNMMSLSEQPCLIKMSKESSNDNTRTISNNNTWKRTKYWEKYMKSNSGHKRNRIYDICYNHYYL